MHKSNVKIFRVPIPTPTLWPHSTTNSYLIGDENESILIDAGYDQKETKWVLEQSLQEFNLAIPKRILLTHAHSDHAPGVMQLADWDASVYCHPLEKEEVLKCIPTLDTLHFLEDNSRLTIGHTEINILHSPGHTAGQLNFYIPSQQILLAGDNLIENGTSWIGTPDGDISQYLQSLNRLKSLQITKVGPGHGDWIINPYEHLEFVYNRRLQRETEIIKLLKEIGPLSSKEITTRIYQNHVHPSILNVAERTTEAHLIKLSNEGITVKDGQAYKLV